MRPDGRAPGQIRPVTFQRRFTTAPAGSCLVSSGRTVVLCTASVTPGVPDWMRGRGQGWLTAEYSMLPGSTEHRKSREVVRGRPEGRTLEIQRLVGRALRAAVSMKDLGESTLWLDCDVLQADGGTRTAAVNGAYVALHDALKWMESRRMLFQWPLRAPVAAISVGIASGEPVVDLDYAEDSKADVDMNVVMAGERFVEVQGTGEHGTFGEEDLSRLLALAKAGISQVRSAQEKALGGG